MVLHWVRNARERASLQSKILCSINCIMEKNRVHLSSFGLCADIAIDP